MQQKILLSILLFASALYSQDIKTTLEEVISTNPIILERLKNYNSSKQDITNAQSEYYPKLDLSVGIGKEDIKKKERPTLEDQSFDYDVYESSLTYTQNFFNGFKTTYKVKQQELKSVSAAYSYIEKVNDTAFEMVDSYLKVMKNIELLENEKENVQINQDIFDKVQKLYDSGLTTLSEVNKIEASLALAKSNEIMQDNTLLNVKYKVHRILGRYIDVQNMLKPELNVKLPETLEDASRYAMQNNPSLLVADYNIKLARAIYEEKNSPFYPSIDVEVSQSVDKNLNAVEGINENLKAMAYLRYNLFNGFADSSLRQKSVSDIHKEIEIKNNLRREVIEGLNLSFASYQKLSEQLIYLSKYKEFSEKTLALYSKEYDLGRRSLLDLLSAQNDFFKSKSQIINAQYDILFAKYRILDAMGILVSSVLGENDSVYLTLQQLENEDINKEDTLNIEFDMDKDKIINDKDICDNSKQKTTIDKYGCKKEQDQVIVQDAMVDINTTVEEQINQDIAQQIEVEVQEPEIASVKTYNSFLFWRKKHEPTNWTVMKLNNIIKKLKPYGFEHIKFNLISNMYYKEMSEEQMLTLSQRRVDALKNILIKNGALEENIDVDIHTDEKMSTNTKLLQNRVDITVTKLKK